MRISIERTGVALAVGATCGLIAWPALGVLVGRLAIPVALVLGATLMWLARRRLPRSLDGSFRTRRGVAIAWSVLALVTIVQTARLSAYMADASRDWFLTTKQEFWSKHMCMVAYFYAADLDRQGEANVYDAAHYPGLNREAQVHPTVANLAPEDPYQYPPPFLLLPRLAIAWSDDFFAIRPVWYALQAIVFLLIAVWLARWVGGTRGRWAAWLVPLLWISVPSMLNFQYGQFHVTTIALALGAFVAFERGRHGFGGSLLAASILAKGFPGILMIPLLLQRRWRAVAWTGVWSVAFTLVTWGVLGSDVFVAFFSHHLPRLRDGSAFAFETAWPELLTPILAGNVSPFALVRKLGELGVPGMSTDLALAFHTGYGFLLLGAAVLAARVHDARRRALVWLALINLSAMTSPAAWGDYVPLGTLWLLTLMIGGTSGRRALWITLAGFVCFLLPGVVPLGSFPSDVASMWLSVATTVLLLGLNGWVTLRGAWDTVRLPSLRPIEPTPEASS